jgi:hypothetical protein
MVGQTKGRIIRIPGAKKKSADTWREMISPWPMAARGIYLALINVINLLERKVILFPYGFFHICQGDCHASILFGFSFDRRCSGGR